MNTSFNYSQLTTFRNNFSATPARNSDNSPSFEIHTLEWMESQQSLWDEEAEKLRNFEVIWIKKGKGFLQADGQNYILTDNTIYCIPPGRIRKATVESGTEGYYISFATEFIFLSEGHSYSSVWLEYFDNQSNITTTLIDRDQHFDLEIIAKKMKWEFSNYFNRRLELLKGLLNIFMIYFSRDLESPCQNTMTDKENELARKFLKLLKKQFYTKKMVTDYASQLCVTPNYLNRIVKKITGFTASHHIQQQIVLEAKRQAFYLSASMKEISYNLGFDNLAHFSKFFKKNCGMNFTDYKKGLHLV
jgi:AraC family transcriptional regulator, transcriptional activator of pobA